MPAQWNVQTIGPQLQTKPLFVGMPLNSAESLSKRQSVAVIASRTDLLAPSDGVPRGIRPLNRGMIAHGIILIARTDVLASKSIVTYESRLVKSYVAIYTEATNIIIRNERR